MTWTKLSDDFSDDCARAGLTDAAFRTHVEGLIWAMRRENAGYLDKIAVQRGIETPNVEAAISELVEAGFWEPTGNGWQIVHHMQHQPEPEVIARRRDQTADRVRRSRRKRAGLDDELGNHVT